MVLDDLQNGVYKTTMLAKFDQTLKARFKAKKRSENLQLQNVFFDLFFI